MRIFVVTAPADLGLCHAVIEQLTQTNAELTRKLAQVENDLAQLLRSKYGPRSEKCDPAQLALFEAATEESAAVAEAAPASSERGSCSYRRNGALSMGAMDLPANESAFNRG